MFDSILEISQLILITLTGVLTIEKLRGAFLDWKIRKKKLKTIEEKDFNKILDSNDILILGDYLENIIGEFTIKDYQKNEDVKQKVDKYLNKVIEFIGSESDFLTEEKLDKPVDIKSNKLNTKEDISVEFELILKELKYGESWNALARLRRHLELLLNELAIKRNIKLERHVSAGQLLRILAINDIVPQKLTKSLLYVLQHCNKAVHGIPITENEASEVVNISAGNIKEIKKLIEATSNNT